MHFDRNFGKYSSGIFLIGIVRVGDELRAEFGPRKYQTPHDRFISTALFSLAELKELCVYDEIIPFEVLPAYSYLNEFSDGLQDLENAQKALAAGLVALDDFPAPEPPLPEEKRLRPPPFLRPFYNLLARFAGTKIEWEDRYHRAEFNERATQGQQCASLYHAKPLPTQMLPRPAANPVQKRARLPFDDFAGPDLMFPPIEQASAGADEHPVVKNLIRRLARADCAAQSNPPARCQTISPLKGMVAEEKFALVRQFEQQKNDPAHIRLNDIQQLADLEIAAAYLDTLTVSPHYAARARACLHNAIEYGTDSDGQPLASTRLRDQVWQARTGERQSPAPAA